MKRTLIIGAGEVGNSLAEVLAGTYEVFVHDKDPPDVENVGALNICFGYSSGFEAHVKAYIAKYEPKVTIIHSTVPVGTTRTLGFGTVHSPIHGVHPNLTKGISTFVKYVGGRSTMAVDLAVEFLRRAGINAEKVSTPEASELSKLLCTTYYAWNVIFAKEAEKLCHELGLPFEEVYGWNESYNRGYEALGKPNVRRPVLQPVPGPIGGHCLIPNAKLLPSWITETILRKNAEYEEDE